MSDFLESLPLDLSGDDILLDCRSPAIARGLENLLRELLGVRNTRTVCLMSPTAGLIARARSVATQLDAIGRLRTDDEPIDDARLRLN